MTFYLNCSRCGLNVVQPRNCDVWEDCPRCLGRDGITAPMRLADDRPWSTATVDESRAVDSSSAVPELSDIGQLVIDRRPCHDGWVLAPRGEVDLASVPALQTALDAMARVGFMRLVLDLRGVSFMDSTGLAAIVAADLRARQGGRQLILVCRGQVKRLFELAGIDRHLNLAESVPTAPAHPEPSGAG
jgi:anti-sigma B factor antagonist